MVAHRDPRQEEVEPADERVEAEVPPGQRLVVVEQGGVGVGEPAPQRPGIGRGEPAEARTPRARAPPGSRRRRWGGGATPTRRAAGRSPPTTTAGRRRRRRRRRRPSRPRAGTPRRTGTSAARHQAVELGGEPVLGRPGEPERAAERGGQREPHVDVLARDGPGRLQHQRAGRRPRPAPRAPAPAATGRAARRTRGRRWWPRSPAAAASARRACSLIVTCRQRGSSGGHDVNPAYCSRSQGRSWWRSTAGRPARYSATASPTARVHRQRADVVDHHEIGVAERGGEPGRRRGPERVDREPLDEHVGPPGTRHGRHVHARAGAGPSPTVRPSPRRRRPCRAGRTGSPRVDRREAP